MATAAVQTVQAISAGGLGVPWIIWSGVISAVVATGVAAFTTRASGKNSLRLLELQQEHDDVKANRQREHDAKQKDEDRKATIRREIYAAAVEETHALLGYIGSLPDRPLNAGNDDAGFQSFLRVNAKIWLVANAEAAHLSRDLASDFGEVFLHVMATSNPIRIAMEPIRLRREEIAFTESEARRLFSQFTDAKARRASFEDQLKLEDLVVEAREDVQALKLAQQQAMEGIARMRMETFQTTFGRLRPVQRAIVKLVSALREELNLPRDDEKFMEQLNDMERRASAAVNSAYGIDPPWPMPEIIEPG